MENEELRLRILEVMSNAGLVNEASVEAAFSPVVAEGTASSDAGNETSGGVAPSSSSATRAASGGAGASRRRVPETPEERLAREVDDGYFDSYSYFDIHRDMIGDKARTDAYRDALEMNPSLIEGKKVLDVGCGTGILSMFAARGRRERRRWRRRRRTHRESGERKHQEQWVRRTRDESDSNRAR